MTAARKKHIRGLVDRLLEQHGAGAPPLPVEKIVEAFGLEIRRAPNSAAATFISEVEHG